MKTILALALVGCLFLTWCAYHFLRGVFYGVTGLRRGNGVADEVTDG